MLSCFHGNLARQASSFIPILLKSVDRAVAQPSQTLAVTEGLCSACLLLKIISSEGDKENKFQNLWNVILDMNKQLFISEKFLSVASEEGNYSFFNKKFGLILLLGLVNLDVLNLQH